MHGEHDELMVAIEAWQRDVCEHVSLTYRAQVIAFVVSAFVDLLIVVGAVQPRRIFLVVLLVGGLGHRRRVRLSSGDDCALTGRTFSHAEVRVSSIALAP